jgi:tRNA (guanine37-N1)-methyltransferase
MIHTYTFKAATETDDDVVRRGSGHLGAEITNATVSEVRDVSPNKLMVLLSFRITPDVAFPSENEETDAKRQRAN